MFKVSISYLLLLLSFNSAYAEVNNIKTKFRVFDSLLYAGKPDLSVYGIEHLALIDHTELWVDQKLGSDIPTSESLIGIESLLTNEGLTVIDIEHWPLEDCSDSVIRSSIYKLVHTVDRIKKTTENLKVGLYAILPKRDYWASIADKKNKKYIDWQESNDKLYNIERQVDVFFPSLYTFYNDREGWVEYAKSTISEARRINPSKPVYVFLWPQYHDSNKSIGLTFIDNEFWRLQLETAKQHADGIVLWGGWDFDKSKNKTWDANAEWWVITKNFAENL